MKAHPILNTIPFAAIKRGQLAPQPDEYQRLRAAATRAKTFILGDAAQGAVDRIAQLVADDDVAPVPWWARFARAPYPATLVQFVGVPSTQGGRKLDFGILIDEDGGESRAWYVVEDTDWIARVRPTDHGVLSINRRDLSLKLRDGRLDENTVKQLMARAWGMTVAFFLLLHAPGSPVALSGQSVRKGVYRGKPVTYAAHHTVEVVLPRVDRSYLRSLIPSDRASPRRHSVRGHWMHFGVDRGCTHDWRPVDGDKDRWRCERCGGRRTWRGDFYRGDAGRGFVTKHYEVAA